MPGLYLWICVHLSFADIKMSIAEFFVSAQYWVAS